MKKVGKELPAIADCYCLTIGDDLNKVQGTEVRPSAKVNRNK